MPKKRIVTCEVCGKRVRRVDGVERNFMAKFPLDEERCKKWVQFAGKEDLVYVPIEKLHSLKYICGDHFEKIAFNKKKNRLRRSAIPTKNPSAKPLPDKMLLEFPLHVYADTTENTDDAPKKIFKVIAASHVAEFVQPGVIESVGLDHCYNKRKHEDHSYCNLGPLTTTILGSAATGKNLDDHNYTTFTNADETAYDSWTSYPSTGYKNLPDSLNRPQGTDKPSDADDSMSGIDLNSIDDSEEPTEAVFSWQKEEILYPTEDTDVMCQKEEKYSELKQELGDVSLYEDSPPGVRDSNLDKHAEYQCNVCEKEIVGFRYTCVQCADWDLCGACEARAAHAAHYVLRVPSPRPYNEIQAVLAAIRQQLLSENLFLSDQITEEGMKLEPVEAEPDPLQRLSDAEDDQTEGSEPGSPRRKRRRLRSSDSDDSSQADSRDDRHAPRDSAAFSNLAQTRQTDRLLPLTQLYSVAQNPSATDNNRGNPAKNNKSAPIEPTVIDLEEMEQFDATGYHWTDHRLGTVQNSDILEPPGYIHKLQSDGIFGGSAIEVASHVIESGDIQPGLSESPNKILQGPDDTIFVEEIDIRMSSDPDVDPIYTGAEEDVRESASDAAGSERVLYLRVPPATDDAALAQALQSQAYVVMQPLVITFQESEDAVR